MAESREDAQVPTGDLQDAEAPGAGRFVPSLASVCPSGEYGRGAQTSSRLLWSRVAELEELRNQLLKLNELVAAVMALQEDIIERVDEHLWFALDYATAAPGPRQRVNTSFSVVLNDTLRDLKK
jgi:hypothetical protein